MPWRARAGGGVAVSGHARRACSAARRGAQGGDVLTLFGTRKGRTALTLPRPNHPPHPSMCTSSAPSSSSSASPFLLLHLLLLRFIPLLVMFIISTIIFIVSMFVRRLFVTVRIILISMFIVMMLLMLLIDIIRHRRMIYCCMILARLLLLLVLLIFLLIILIIVIIITRRLMLVVIRIIRRRLLLLCVLLIIMSPFPLIIVLRRRLRLFVFFSFVSCVLLSFFVFFSFVSSSFSIGLGPGSAATGATPDLGWPDVVIRLLGPGRGLARHCQHCGQERVTLALPRTPPLSIGSVRRALTFCAPGTRLRILQHTTAIPHPRDMPAPFGQGG